MNNSEILAKVFQLKDMIVENELYKDLKIKEKEMMDNDECFNLLCLYQNVQSKYNEAKRFENFGCDVNSIAKELSDIKCKVDNNQLVKAYNVSYKKVKQQLKDVESLLFKDIVKEKKEIVIE